MDTRIATVSTDIAWLIAGNRLRCASADIPPSCFERFARCLEARGCAVAVFARMAARIEPASPSPPVRGRRDSRTTELTATFSGVFCKRGQGVPVGERSDHRLFSREKRAAEAINYPFQCTF
jgi:hypothetical protein